MVINFLEPTSFCQLYPKALLNREKMLQLSFTCTKCDIEIVLITSFVDGYNCLC